MWYARKKPWAEIQLIWTYSWLKYTKFVLQWFKQIDFHSCRGNFTFSICPVRLPNFLVDLSQSVACHLLLKMPSHRVLGLLHQLEVLPGQRPTWLLVKLANLSFEVLCAHQVVCIPKRMWMCSELHQNTIDDKAWSSKRVWERTLDLLSDMRWSRNCSADKADKIPTPECPIVCIQDYLKNNDLGLDLT